jgi:hypothetical protein
MSGRLKAPRGGWADVTKILEVYPLSAFADEKNPAQVALARIMGDAQLVCSTWDASTRMQKLGGGVWTYNFDVPVVIASMPDLGLGASHARSASARAHGIE